MKAAYIETTGPAENVVKYGDLPVPEGAPPLLAMLRMPTREYIA